MTRLDREAVARIIRDVLEKQGRYHGPHVETFCCEQASFREAIGRAADAILALLPPSSALRDGGWRLVPEKLTHEMIVAGMCAIAAKCSEYLPRPKLTPDADGNVVFASDEEVASYYMAVGASMHSGEEAIAAWAAMLAAAPPADGALRRQDGPPDDKSGI